MAVLTTKQRQYLRGLAHPLTPIVRIGKAGVTDNVVAETRKSLDAHELIKVRIDVDAGAERREVADRLAEATDAQLAGTIGKVAILYREREEKPEIKLPR
ncbi:MAG TPA: ribosome assembly RNA-binding protein YhbY [Thermoanaerobaculia bacterium]|nr:ribosome assembly RNA-binding protein YhbY [Thermoanaerobaculia bacterium]